MLQEDKTSRIHKRDFEVNKQAPAYRGKGRQKGNNDKTGNYTRGLEYVETRTPDLHGSTSTRRNC